MPPILHGRVMLVCIILFLCTLFTASELTTSIYPIPTSTDSMIVSFEGVVSTDDKPPESLRVAITPSIPFHADISIVVLVVFSPDYHHTRLLQMDKSEDNLHFSAKFLLPPEADTTDAKEFPIQLLIYTPSLPPQSQVDVEFVFVYNEIYTHSTTVTANVHHHLAKEAGFYTSCDNIECRSSAFTLHIKGLRSDLDALGILLPNTSLVQLHPPGPHSGQVRCWVNQLQSNGKYSNITYPDDNDDDHDNNDDSTHIVQRTMVTLNIASSELLMINGAPFYQDGHYTIVCPELAVTFLRSFEADRSTFLSIYPISIFGLHQGMATPTRLPLPRDVPLMSHNYLRYAPPPNLRVQSYTYPVSSLRDYVYAIVNVSYPMESYHVDKKKFAEYDHDIDHDDIDPNHRLDDFHSVLGSISFSGLLCENFNVNITSFISDLGKYQRIYSDSLLLTELNTLTFNTIDREVDHLQITLMCTSPVQRIDQGRKLHSVTTAFTFPNLLLPMEIQTAHAPIGVPIAQNVTLFSRIIPNTETIMAGMDKASFRLRFQELTQSLDLLEVYLLGNHQFAGGTEECYITNVPPNANNPDDYKPSFPVIAFFDIRTLTSPSSAAVAASINGNADPDEGAPFRIQAYVLRVISKIPLDQVDSRFSLICPHIYVVPSMTTYPTADFLGPSYFQVEGWHFDSAEVVNHLERSGEYERYAHEVGLTQIPVNRDVTSDLSNDTDDTISAKSDTQQPSAPTVQTVADYYIQTRLQTADRSQWSQWDGTKASLLQSFLGISSYQPSHVNGNEDNTSSLHDINSLTHTTAVTGSTEYYSWSSPFHVLPSEHDENDEDDEKGNNRKAVRIAIIVIGCIAGVGTILTTIYFILQRRRQRMNQRAAATQIQNERQITFSDHHVIPDTFYNNADGEYVLFV